MDHARELHLLEHVERVVAGRTVGRQANGHAMFAHALQPQSARDELGIAAGAMRDLGARLSEDTGVVVVELRTMRGGDIRLQEAERMQPADWRSPVGFGDVGYFLRSFRQMGVDRYLVRVGDLAHQLVHFCAAGIGSVRREADLQQTFTAVVMPGYKVAEAIQGLPRPVGDRCVDTAIRKAISERRAQRDNFQRLDLGLDCVGVEMLVE